MKLVIEDETGTRSVVPFDREGIVVGRDADGVTFRLADRNVSRRHARFLLLSGTAFVEDLGSLNGTRVNGERISGRRKLREGDLVQIGGYDLAVLAEEVALAPVAPPPLPVTGRGDDPTTTVKLSLDTTPPPRSPLRAAALRARVRALKIALLVAAAALAIALVAGWASGALTLTPP